MPTPMIAPLAAAQLPASVTRLTFKQLVQLFRDLNGTGKVGFDFANYRLDGLYAILLNWSQSGHPLYALDRIDAFATAMLAAPAMPAPPAVTRSPRAAAPQPAPAPVYVPAPPSVQAQAAAAVLLDEFDPAPGPQAAPQPFAATVAPPTPVVAPQAAYAPVAGLPAAMPVTFPCRVPAATIWPEFAQEFATHCPDMTVELWGNPEAPAIRPDYVFQFGHVLAICAAFASTPTARVWCGGPRGTGKTEFARQFAARTGRPLFRVNFNRATEASEVIGDQGLRSGNTLWVDGPVAAAMRTPGGLLLLDEISYANPGNISALNPILEADGAHLRLPRTSDTIVAAAGFAVIACDNTYGFGDPSQTYAARNLLGQDTRDRFNVALTFAYLTADEEAALLVEIVRRRTGKRLLKDVAKAIVRVITVSRAKVENGEMVSGAPSLRGASAFACQIVFGVPVADAFTQCIVLNAPPEVHEALRQDFAAHWSPDLVKFTA